jgi:hypothetical protein
MSGHLCRTVCQSLVSMIGLEFLHQLETSPQGAIGFAMGRPVFHAGRLAGQPPTLTGVPVRYAVCCARHRLIHNSS